MISTNREEKDPIQLIMDADKQNLDVKSKDSMGKTPLHIACTYGQQSMVEKLLKVWETMI